MSNVILQWATLEAEYNIAFIARGSNPPNQDSREFTKLLRYCIRNGHWSPFQMAVMCLEFETSLAVAAQVKRHWSMAINEPADIQETSMRYMDPFEHGWGFQPIEFRKVAESNRQSSSEPLSSLEQNLVDGMLQSYFTDLANIRLKLKKMGVANETIRMLYPQCTTTKFFISGSCRSWIHYFQQRIDPHAQKEHIELAKLAYEHFTHVFPTISTICQAENLIRLTEEEKKDDARI